MAYDLDRDDWRTFRIDRVADAEATGWVFRPRDHEDPVAFVQRSVTVGPYEHRCRVRFEATVDEVRSRVPATIGAVEPVGGRCELVLGSQDLYAVAYHLAVLDLDFEVIEPVELCDAVRKLGERLSAAADR